MKALVSGSNGFIGSHLMQALKAQDILAIPIPRDYLQQPMALRGWVCDKEPDLIFHLAAYGNHSTQRDAQDAFEANIIGTWNLLQATKHLKLQAFINVGSSSEYGRKIRPMHEDDCLAPQTFYAATKAAATLLARACVSQYSQPIVTVRPFSVYGEGEADFRFIPTIIRCLKQRLELTLDPLPCHDWIYIDDFIAGLLTVMENAPRLAGEVVNIGTGRQYSNRDVVGTLEMITGKLIQTRLVEGQRSNDSDYWVASNNVLKSLGWKQQYSLLDGLTKTYYGMDRESKAA